MKAVMIALAALTISPAVLAGDLPPVPGVVNADVTQANIHQTICVKGWTRTVRPAQSYTRALKLRLIGPDGDPKDYELDHVIPLSLGGSPADPRNLWAQHWHGQWGAYTKDRLELKLQGLVCAGQLPLATAQKSIATNWIETYETFCPTRADCPSYEELQGDE